MRGSMVQAVRISAKMKGWDPDKFIANTHTVENADSVDLGKVTNDVPNQTQTMPAPVVLKSETDPGPKSNPYPGMDM